MINRPRLYRIFYFAYEWSWKKSSANWFINIGLISFVHNVAALIDFSGGAEWCEFDKVVCIRVVADVVFRHTSGC